MTVKTSHFPTSVLGSFTNNVITVSEKPVYTVVSNHVLLTELKKSYSSFFEVFGKQTYSGLGKDLEASDNLRDEPLRGIRSILKGFVKVSGYAYHKEAEELLSLMNQYGDEINKMSYSAENESLDKLFAVFDQEQNLTKLAHLNLSELYSTLKSRHADFKTLYYQQTQANAELRQLESASGLRYELNQALRNYLNMVTAMRSVTGWAALYAELNELAKSANNSVGTTKATPTEASKA